VTIIKLILVMELKVNQTPLDGKLPSIAMFTQTPTHHPCVTRGKYSNTRSKTIVFMGRKTAMVNARAVRCVLRTSACQAGSGCQAAAASALLQTAF
jgi:hypothetical protein